MEGCIHTFILIYIHTYIHIYIYISNFKNPKVVNDFASLVPKLPLIGSTVVSQLAQHVNKRLLILTFSLGAL